MPVEVTASLSRGSVFIAGELLECQLSFKNNNVESNTEMLAWASAQVLCQCTVNEGKLRRIGGNKSSEQGNSGAPIAVKEGVGGGSSGWTNAGSETSFVPNKGEQGFTVLSNKPTILFCNLMLRPGETKSCTYRDNIPFEAPPSFRGQSIKYSYKLVIGIQKLNCPTRLLRLPFRVISVPGLTEATVFQLTTEEVQPANPFVERAADRSDSVLDASLHLLSQATSPKQLSNYNISNARGSVVRFTLFKQVYRLGEDIIGIFDFSQAAVPCLQCTVTLQSEESAGQEPEESGSKASGLITAYTQTHTSCLCLAQSHLSLHIPPTVTPAFSTDLVSLRWRLHFEFVTLTAALPEPPEQMPNQVVSWKPPESIDTETMVWDLPILVYPSNPLTLTGQGLATTAVVTC